MVTSVVIPTEAGGWRCILIGGSARGTSGGPLAVLADKYRTSAFSLQCDIKAGIRAQLTSDYSSEPAAAWPRFNVDLSQSSEGQTFRVILTIKDESGFPEPLKQLIESMNKRSGTKAVRGFSCSDTAAKFYFDTVEAMVATINNVLSDDNKIQLSDRSQARAR